MSDNTAGHNNTAVGSGALTTNTEGFENTAIGDSALSDNTTGFSNTATGISALASNTDGGLNTAMGNEALFRNTTGGQNTAVGNGAGSNITTGNGNVAVGVHAGTNVTTADDVICIGHPGRDVSHSCFIENIFGVTSGGVGVFINSFGRLGTMTSSKRFKEEIKPMNQASEALFALKPVTFHYKKEIDPEGTSQFGLVAEDVFNVNPDLVVRDKDGKPYSVRYEQVNAMLLNEFLKEHRQVREQRATIAQLKSAVERQEIANARQQKQIEALTAGLQKVSAQLEMSKPAPQTVLNNQ
jgi:uncharacterized coiled-coil protein SlyX